MTQTSNVSGTSSLYETYGSSSSTKETGSSDFSSDDFMELLLIQLRNQNPLDPMDEKEMIVQMSQMNTVSELQQLNETMASMEKSNKLLSAANLIGKVVTYLASDGSKDEMTVESVELEGDDILLNAGKVTINYSNVIEVSEAEEAAAESGESDE